MKVTSSNNQKQVTFESLTKGMVFTYGLRTNHFIKISGDAAREISLKGEVIYPQLSQVVIPATEVHIIY